MGPVSINSLDNPLLKEFARLQNNRRFREKSGKIAVEGPNLVVEALKAGLFPEVFLFSADYYENEGRDILAELPGQARQFVMPPALFKKIAQTETPQPVAAIFWFARPEYEGRLERVPALAILLDRIQDPGNMGTIMRTAAGAGANVIYYTKGSTDPYAPKVLRATAGSVFHLPVQQVSDSLRLSCDLKEKGVQVVAAAARGGLPPWEADFKRPTTLIVGNEAGGVAGELLSEADLKVTIPLKGPVESLNAATASAMILYEIVRQRGF